ncbi:MAG: hypothetical protein RIM72_16045 [Alphaproteobacteria bacterium]
MALTPTEKFSSWYPWESRGSFPGDHYRGVYVIAASEPELPVLEIPEAIIYIGETHGASRSLKKRLYNFNKSGSRGKRGHAGGVTYFGKGLDPEFNDIFFSVLPCDLTDQAVNTAWIFFKERELIWKYADKHGRLPACNSE